MECVRSQITQRNSAMKKWMLITIALSFSGSALGIQVGDLTVRGTIEGTNGTPVEVSDGGITGTNGTPFNCPAGIVGNGGSGAVETPSGIKVTGYITDNAGATIIDEANADMSLDLYDSGYASQWTDKENGWLTMDLYDHAFTTRLTDSENSRAAVDIYDSAFGFPFLDRANNQLLINTIWASQGSASIIDLANGHFYDDAGAVVLFDFTAATPMIRSASDAMVFDLIGGREAIYDPVGNKVLDIGSGNARLLWNTTSDAAFDLVNFSIDEPNSGSTLINFSENNFAIHSSSDNAEVIDLQNNEWERDFVVATNAHLVHYGPTNQNGSCRTGIITNSYVVEARQSGSWVRKSTVPFN